MTLPAHVFGSCETTQVNHPIVTPYYYSHRSLLDVDCCWNATLHPILTYIIMQRSCSWCSVSALLDLLGLARMKKNYSKNIWFQKVNIRNTEAV